MLILDRYEEEIAVLEGEAKETIEIPKKYLPREAGEGDVVKIVIDREKTKKRKEDIQDLSQDLFE